MPMNINLSIFQLSCHLVLQIVNYKVAASTGIKLNDELNLKAQMRNLHYFMKKQVSCWLLVTFSVLLSSLVGE